MIAVNFQHEASTQPVAEKHHSVASETKGDASIALHLFELPETPDEIPLVPGQRVVAIGDVHGCFNGLKCRLMAAGLIKEEKDGESNSVGGVDQISWTGGNTVLVQVGDIVDRGCQELECFLLLCKLGRQAKMVDGAVVILWGNHEFLNARGDYDDSVDGNRAWSRAFGKALEHRHGRGWRKGFWNVPRWGDDEARWAAMEPGGLLAVPLLSKLKVMVKVGRSVFVHAGFQEADIKEKERSAGIAGMNRIMKKFILEPQDGDRNHVHKEPPMSFLRNTLFMRDYSEPTDQEPTGKDIKETVNRALDSVEADRMVVGHSTQNAINSVLDGTVWRIDVRHEALEIMRRDDGTECETVLRSKSVNTQARAKQGW